MTERAAEIVIDLYHVQIKRDHAPVTGLLIEHLWGRALSVGAA
jgi:hypothetical protein